MARRTDDCESCEVSGERRRDEARESGGRRPGVRGERYGSLLTVMCFGGDKSRTSLLARNKISEKNKSKSPEKKQKFVFFVVSYRCLFSSLLKSVFNRAINNTESENVLFFEKFGHRKKYWKLEQKLSSVFFFFCVTKKKTKQSCLKQPTILSEQILCF